jgi:hypothetical protein
MRKDHQIQFLLERKKNGILLIIWKHQTQNQILDSIYVYN